MNILIVGGGGREHALTWAIARSPKVGKVYVAPGNGGTETIAENITIAPGDIDALIRFASDNDVSLTIVGPEAPLVAGIVDRFAEAGLRCFGPGRDAARLEGSKVFAKEFMARHDIPTADFAVFDDPDAAREHVSKGQGPLVIKADGLAEGKGVIVALRRDQALAAVDQIMVQKKFGEGGGRVVVEEFLEGEEVSVHSICGGGRAVLFPASQDHKRVFDGDEGPNTGGMGAYAPVPFLDKKTRSEIFDTVVMRVLQGMEKDGSPFNGVLYAGMMLTPSGPKVLEFNVRFGDPETQVILPLLKSDLLGVLDQAADGKPVEKIELHEGRCAATVVVASRGYPGSHSKGAPIGGLAEVDGRTRVAFHAGTTREDGRLVTSGGRVLAVSAWADSLPKAIRDAYDGVAHIEFNGAFSRSDIGKRAI